MRPWSSESLATAPVAAWRGRVSRSEMGGRRLQRALVAPLVLLAVVLLEEIAAYQVRRHVADMAARTATLVFLYGVGFALAAIYLIPWIRSLVTSAQRTTRREGGELAVWLLFAAAYGLIYYAFYLIESRGMAALLPAALR